MKTRFLIIIGMLGLSVIVFASLFLFEKQGDFEIFTTVELSGQILSIDFDDDYNVIVGTKNGHHIGTLYYVDSNGKIIWQKNTQRIIGFADITDDGKYITTQGYELTDKGAQIYHDNLIELFDNNGTKLWDFPKREFSLLSNDIDPTSYSVTTDDEDSLLIVHEDELLWFDNSGNMIWNYTLVGKSRSIDMSDNGKFIAVSSSEVLDGVDYDWGLDVFTNDGQHMWQKSGGDYHVISNDAVAVSYNGNYIALGLAALGDEGIIQVFDNSGILKWTDITDSVVLDVYFSHDEKNLIASTNNGLRFYDIQGNLLWTKDETFNPRFSTEYVIGSSPVLDYYVLKVMDYTGNILLEFQIKSPVRDIEITNDSNMIVVGTKGESDFGPGILYYFKR